VRQEGVVGASLVLVHDGTLARLETEGMANLAEGRPIDESTIYHWASITKTFTAIAVMQLRDRELLTLDDSIVDYVPELRDVRNPFGSMEEVTIRHLLTHSAGFRASTWPWGGERGWHPHEPTEWSQLVAMIPYTEIPFQPGSRYSYSNPGIIFLGRVIEKVSPRVRVVHRQEHLPSAGNAVVLLRRDSLAPSRPALQSLLRSQRRAGAGRTGLQYRDYRLEWRPQRSSDRHGALPGFPDGRSCGRRGLRRGARPFLTSGDMGAPDTDGIGTAR
jgi:hypothetical protein